MPIPPEIQTVIDRLDRELNEIELESTEGLNLTRELLSRFPDNAILTQTEQVETVMTLMEVKPNLPQCQEVTLLQCGTLMVLWFFVLLAQFLLFWQSKKRG